MKDRPLGKLQTLQAWLYVEVFGQDILSSQDCMAYGLGWQGFWSGHPMSSDWPTQECLGAF